jgi:hypothetical protein
LRCACTRTRGYQISRQDEINRTASAVGQSPNSCSVEPCRQKNQKNHRSVVISSSLVPLG